MDTNSDSNPSLLRIRDICDRGAAVALWRQSRVLCSSPGFEINIADVKTAAYQVPLMQYISEISDSFDPCSF